MNILFTPIKIGTIEVKNRIVMPPMEMNYATTDGGITERIIEHYERRARGGVGFISSEATFVDPSGKGRTNQTGIYDDKFIPGWKKLVDAVHKYDVKIAMQIMHTGRQTALEITGQQPIAPSEVACACSVCHEMPHQLTLKEIDWLIERFAQGGRRAKEAGLDAVMVHGAHGYIVNQFLSPYTNKRSDEYGGDLERRMKFPLEIVARIKEKVGEDFPLLYRLTADEYLPGSLTIDDSIIFCKRLEEAGVDAIDVTAGIYESGQVIFSYMHMPQGFLRHLMKAVKKAVNIPVIGVGGIVEPSVAEDIIKGGDADLVNLGRALLADPDWPKKVQEGRLDEIRKCIRCKECIFPLVGDKATQGPVYCFENPQLGHEKEYEIKPAPTPKKVLIIGGGVGGMEAARVGKMRGHKVTLFEKSKVLGGQFLLACKAQHKREAKNTVDYLAGQMKKLNIDLRLNQEANLNVVKSMGPEVIIVATGATPIIPKVPGVNLSHVVTAHDVLADRVEVKENALVVGGGLVGIEAALYLKEKGKKVMIVEMLDELACDALPYARTVLLEEVYRLKIPAHTNTKIKEIKENAVVVEKLRRKQLVRIGEKIIKPIDTVVLAMGTKPERSLLEVLTNEGYAVHAVGDCVQPRRGLHAIHEGFVTALRI